MADFKLAVEKTLQYEGGYSDNPNDPGGATNFGITLNVLQGLGSLADFNHDGVIDKTDIQIMTKEEAESIYKQLYWNGDNIQSQAIATKNFDMGVNLGVVSAAKLLQQALVTCGFTVVIDGKFGPKTINAINASSPQLLMTALCSLQDQYYWTIVEKDIEKNAQSRNWPQQLINDAILACQTKNLKLISACVLKLKSLKLKAGKIVFLNGWIKRASDRFGI